MRAGSAPFFVRAAYAEFVLRSVETLRCRLDYFFCHGFQA